MQNNTFSALFVGQNIVKLTEVDSTNTYLKYLLSKYEPLPEGTVILAEHQFAGRGQYVNVWQSSKGENLTFSIYLKPNFLPVNRQFELSKAISLGIVDCLSVLLGEGFAIKWPNDIYYQNCKIGGLLIENTVAKGYIKSSIVGLGLNVNQTEFRNLLHASSLKNIKKEDLALDDLLKKLCFYIEQRYLQLKNSKIEILQKDYLGKLFRLNEMADFVVDGDKVIGKIVNVSEIGELIVEINNENRYFNLKEIEFVLR